MSASAADKATTPSAATTQPDKRRITEQDADFRHIRAGVERALWAGIRRYARALQSQPPSQHAKAASTFIAHQMRALQTGYLAGHWEGERDYWHAFSAKQSVQAHSALSRRHRVEPNVTRMRRALMFYGAASITKMAREAQHAWAADQHATIQAREYGSFVTLFNPNHDPHTGEFSSGGGSGGSDHAGKLEQARSREAKAAQRVSAATDAYHAEIARVRQEHGIPSGHPLLETGRQDARFQAARAELQAAHVEHHAAVDELSRLDVHTTDDVTRHDPIEIDRTSTAIFGRALTNEEYRALVGAPHDANLEVTADHESKTLQIHMDGEIAVAGRDEPISYEAERAVYKDGRAIVLENQSFIMSASGTGHGSEIFASEVHNASQMGVRRIETFGARVKDEYGQNAMNGYYTWPRLGYDAEIPSSYRARLPESLQGATKFSDLMKTAEGRDWWKANGEGQSYEFDLRKGSLSHRVLDAYMSAKAREAVKAAERRSTRASGHEEITLAPQDEAILDRVWARISADDDTDRALTEASAWRLDDAANAAMNAWLGGLTARVSLSADIAWTGLQDGYLAAGTVDPANPYAVVWWQMEPTAVHCEQCPDLAAASPFTAPGAGGNELPQTPGDGGTDCGGACKCTLQYGSSLMSPSTWAAPPGADDWMQRRSAVIAEALQQRTPAAQPDEWERNRQQQIAEATGLMGQRAPATQPVPDAWEIERQRQIAEALRSQRGQFGPHYPPMTPEPPAGAARGDEAVWQRIADALVPGAPISEEVARQQIADAPIDGQLTEGQKQALDLYRTAAVEWDKVRGALPPLDLFHQGEEWQTVNFDNLTPEQMDAYAYYIEALREWADSEPLNESETQP